MSKLKIKFPTIKELSSLIRSIKMDIPHGAAAADYTDTGNGDTSPSIDVTIGYTPKTGNWGYQTGDNSYSGGAYGHPNWATTRVYPRSNSRELARDIIAQLSELTWGGVYRDARFEVQS